MLSNKEYKLGVDKKVPAPYKEDGYLLWRPLLYTTDKDPTGPDGRGPVSVAVNIPIIDFKNYDYLIIVIFIPDVLLL